MPRRTRKAIGLGHALAGLHLDRLAAGFLKYPDGGLMRLRRAALVGAEGHVNDYQRA